MIRRFLIERKSWILLILLFHALLLFISYLDSQIPVSSIAYYVFLSFIIFVLFIIIRYRIESRYYRQLRERTNYLDEADLPTPVTPFEKIASTNITKQTEQLKQVQSHNQTNLEQEKDELLSWIHEVKTPLTAMQLIIDRIEDQHLKADLNYEWLRVHLLLDQQLHKKRMSIIENDLYIEKTELEPIIFQEIKTLKSWCIHRGIGFDINLNETKVLSDGKWLAFIIRQILSNAVKYSKNSNITITSMTHDDQKILTIQDQGRGIDIKDLPRIFEKGFTSTAEHQDNAATGMGLYLTKRVANSLHIKIDIQSKPGEGTTLKLTFPKKNDFVDIAEV
ncbi:sensor histidine kinase [Tenuibacillus multivorans]|uniref:histidine kinase n=1 Tax=Tenuibacillus multivorans TaxID=237069 RepID=A0A1G9WM41_9BACI|nr:sensor histidine kinase [Tenuibacillus multivorans]GEL76504.1 sensor protein BceS [Tenuibacillus multivorans]SDM85115.1 two-component system, OmpR family, bacitracin resistance sensor histidine kinase BceS [Tenuibacillus multivorans]